MSKSCVQCLATFDVTDEDRAFYKRIHVPEPTFCPACRFQRRCAFVNVRNFYPRVLDGASQATMSMYSQDLDLNIVEDERWWSDDFNLFDYGKDYDFNTPFFAQFHTLMKATPLPHLQRNFSTFQNSEYCNAASGLKNCYLITNADNDEDCMYGFCVEECKSCIDVLFTNKSELCFECINVKSCYGCRYCDNCEISSDLVFCKDCIGCKHCFGCIGLRQKSYHIFNTPYSKEDYHAKIAALNTGSRSVVQQIQNQVEDFFLKNPQKSMHGRSNENVSGDYIYQSKDTQDSYVVEFGEHCKFGHFLRYLSSGTHDAYDYTMFGVGADRIYETAWCGLGIHNIKFSVWNYGSSDLEYCFGCHNSQYMFGCIGLRHQKYCILNRQYTKEEYEELVPKIREHMMQMPYRDESGIEYRYGEFFPIALSPYHYNQTIAQDYCPLSEQACKVRNYGWHKREGKPLPEYTHWQDLPDTVEAANESVLNTPVLCRAHSENPKEAEEHGCSRVFTITAQELALYRQMNVPLPRYCCNSRHYQKLRLLNPFALWNRECAKCQSSLRTTYAPDRPEIVYCENCYLKDVY